MKDVKIVTSIRIIRNNWIMITWYMQSVLIAANVKCIIMIQIFVVYVIKKGNDIMKEVIFYFENGNRSKYYNVDNITWTAKTVYLDIYNAVINTTDTICIEKEQISQILVNVR